MFLSNLRKSFIASGLLIIGFSACWLWQKNDNRSAAPVNVDKGEFPFSTREPDVFQCDIITTADGSSQTYFFARKKEKSRYDIHRGDEDQVSTIHSDKDYLISYQRKVYTEVAGGGDTGANSLDDFTNGLLKREEAGKFEEIGGENNLTKYRVKVNEGNASEIVIFVDPAVGLPIKEEFYSVTGNKKTLGFSVELRNLNLEVDDGVFAIPTGFRRVSIDEFRKPDKIK